MSAGGAVVDIIAITAIAGILIGAMNLTGVAFSLTQQLLTNQRRQPAAAARHHGVRIIHSRAAAADGRRLHYPRDARRAGAGAGRHRADAGAHVRAVQRHPRHGDAAGCAGRLRGGDHRAIDQWQTGWTATRMSWCSYFMPFMFAYTPALIMNGAPPSIAPRSRSGAAWRVHGNGRRGRLFQARVSCGRWVGYGVIALHCWCSRRCFGARLGQRRSCVCLLALAREMCGRAQRNWPAAGPAPSVLARALTTIASFLPPRKRQTWSTTMRIDAYTHFFPKKFFDKLNEVAGDYKDMGKRVRSLPALYDLDVRKKIVDGHKDYQQILSYPQPPIETLRQDAGRDRRVLPHHQ